MSSNHRIKRKKTRADQIHLDSKPIGSEHDGRASFAVNLTGRQGLLDRRFAHAATATAKRNRKPDRGRKGAKDEVDQKTKYLSEERERAGLSVGPSECRAAATHVAI